MKTVGERMVEGLAARGVEVIFGIPGVHTVEMYRGLSGSSVRHVTARHEQGCAFMADGYARASGKPGVALVITGPGVTNALTAMAQSREDSVPVLIISGVNRRDSLGKGLGRLHELPDQGAMVRTLCPSRQITDPSEVGAVLDWAFATMATGRPGPVHIEVPTDVMPLPCPPLLAPAALPARPVASDVDLARAAEMLNAAKRPVIIAGGGARGLNAALRTLAERLDAPVVQTVNARGMMHLHPLCVPASPSLEAVRALIAASDQVLVLGSEIGPTDYDMYAIGNLPKLDRMIRVDLCTDQLARHPAALKLQADVGGFIAAIVPRLQAKLAAGEVRAETTRGQAQSALGELYTPMPGHLQMVEAIRAGQRGCVIVGDSTQPVYAANLYYDHDRAGGWFNAATGYGALGFGPGAAVGAALALPGVPVVCLIGDGGLQFSPGELRTAVDEKLPITFVVWNNAAFMEIAEAMRNANTEVIGCSPSPLRMEPFAAACDLPFTSIPEEPEALTLALTQECEGPRMIEIRAKR
jgi:acetolactate synthase-1/2/3 large subunit